MLMEAVVINLVLVAALTSGVSPVTDGTVLFLENSNKLVSGATDSSVTHVAMVLLVSAEPWVYEATPAKVRRLPLPEYMKEVTRLNERRKKPMRVFAVQPRRAYSKKEVEGMRKHLEAQLGRRYSVRGYVRDEPAEGVHCSELASITLNHSGRFRFTECHQITPARLANLLTAGYAKPMELTTPAPAKRSWCQRTSECWGDFVSWCGWACVRDLDALSLRLTSGSCSHLTSRRPCRIAPPGWRRGSGTERAARFAACGFPLRRRSTSRSWRRFFSCMTWFAWRRRARRCRTSIWPRWLRCRS